jgi:hypothetical protein
LEGNLEETERITKTMMEKSLSLWKKKSEGKKVHEKERIVSRIFSSF